MFNMLMLVLIRIFRLLKLDLNGKIKLDNKKFTLNQYEIEILKKISEWPKCM